MDVRRGAGGEADWLEEDGEGEGEGILAGAEGGQMELGGGWHALSSTPPNRSRNLRIAGRHGVAIRGSKGSRNG